MTKPEIVLALDGLLTKATSGKLGPPLPGAAEFTRRLGQSFRVVIQTSRTNFDLDLDRPEESQIERALFPIKTWLDEYKIWYDEVHLSHNVPQAMYFVGHRNITSPKNPSPGDFVQLEREINMRLAQAREKILR